MSVTPDTPVIEWYKLAATILLTLIAAGIAVRQAMVARQKFRLDLFEQREPIFQAVWAACSAYCWEFERTRAYAAAEAMKNLAPRASFLFGREIYDYMLEARKQMGLIDTFESRAERGIVETPEVQARINAARAWLAKEADDGCKEKFAKYLDFSKWA